MIIIIIIRRRVSRLETSTAADLQYCAGGLGLLHACWPLGAACPRAPPPTPRRRRRRRPVAAADAVCAYAGRGGMRRGRAADRGCGRDGGGGGGGGGSISFLAAPPAVTAMAVAAVGARRTVVVPPARTSSRCSLLRTVLFEYVY
jgi:hypothetical protein